MTAPARPDQALSDPAREPIEAIETGEAIIIRDPTLLSRLRLLAQQRHQSTPATVRELIDAALKQ
jgi:hypothetical protein